MHHRCSGCGARRHLRPLPTYQRVPRCRRCGGQRYYVDHYRMAHEVGRGAGRPCTNESCQYTFPHRRGSRWCIHNPNWTAKDAEAWFDTTRPDEDLWWMTDPLCFGQRPTTSDEAPF